MRLAALLALLLSLPAAAQDFDLAPEFSFAPEFGPQGQLAPSLLLLSPGQVAVAPLHCPASRSLGFFDTQPPLLPPSYACLNGDGTQDSSSGMTLSAVGSPTTQTMAWCPNGVDCADVTRERWTTSDSYQSAILPAPTGDFSVCHIGMVDAPLSAVTLVSGPGYSLSVTSAGVVTFTSGGSSVSSASGAVVGGADQLICGTRAGTAGVIYVGSSGVLGTVAAPSGSAVVKVGAFAGGTRGVFFTSKVLSSAEVAMLDRALVPQAQTATGVPLTFARNSLASCPAPDGSMTWLPPGRPCISEGLRMRPRADPLSLNSERLDASPWSAFFSGTATADTWTAPDGSLTGDTITSPNSTNTNGRFQDVAQTTFAANYTESVSLQAGSVESAQIQMQAYGGTTANKVCAVTGLPSTGSVRATCTMSPTMAPVRGNSASLYLGLLGTPTTKNGHYYKVTTAGTSAASEPTWCATSGCTVADGTATWTEQGLTRIRAAITVGASAVAGNIHAWGAQLDASAVASAYCRQEGALVPCLGETATIAAPSWLNPREGCAAFTLRPTWTGATPGSSYYLSLGSNARLMGITAGASGYAAIGDAAPAVAMSSALDAPKRFRVSWSLSAGGVTLQNVTTGAESSAALTSAPSFDSVLSIGNSGGASQPFGAAISDIVLGKNSGGCTQGQAGASGFAAWGDSLTGGTGSTSGNSYPSQLSTLLGGRSTYNGGIGGQISTQIAARQGGVVPTVSVSGDQIPASGAVSVTAISVALLSTPASTSARSIDGTLAGVPGTLSKDTSDAYTFTRTTSGSVTACPPGTPFLVDTAAHSSWAQVLWYGRNNFFSPGQVEADIAASIAAMPEPKRFVVLSVLNGDNASEYEGGADYATITGLNNDLAALYPSNYIDVRSLLVSHYDPGVAQDVIDHGHDVPPSSLRSDAVHLNDAGYAYVAQAVADFIRGKGW